MGEIVPAIENSSGPRAPRKRRSWRRTAVRGAAIYVVIPYIAIAVLIAVFQRSLIYHPSRGSVVLEAGRKSTGTIHTIVVKAHDGLELNGWHCLPEGCTAKDAAECDSELGNGRLLVLYFPGNAGKRSDRAADCRDFTHTGANVMLVDYRGYADNPGSPSESEFAADARSIWNYAVERGVPPDRIVVFGESLGGGVATRLAAEMCAAGTPPAGLILSSTFSSMVDTAGWHYPYLPVGMLLRDRYPSVQRAPSITCPVLQLHGAIDTIVPINFAKRLSDAFPDTSVNGIKKKFIELSNAGHNDMPSAEFSTAVREFFDAIQAARSNSQEKSSR